MKKYQSGDNFPDLCFDTINACRLQTRQVLRGKTVFWVLRYIGCPVCNYDVHLLSRRYAEFQAKNAQLFVVMQSDAQHLRAALANGELPFEIICDPEQKFYRALGISAAESMEQLLGQGLAELEAKGAQAAALGISHGDYEGNEQQLPALFIVEADGVISYAHYASELMDMPNIDQVLQLL